MTEWPFRGNGWPIGHLANMLGEALTSTQTALHMDSITTLEDGLQAVRSQLYKASPAVSCISEAEMEKDDEGLHNAKLTAKLSSSPLDV